jgi:hypothetical protein
VDAVHLVLLLVVVVEKQGGAVPRVNGAALFAGIIIALTNTFKALKSSA